MLKKLSILMLIMVCLSAAVFGCGIKSPPIPPDAPDKKK